MASFFFKTHPSHTTSTETSYSTSRSFIRQLFPSVIPVFSPPVILAFPLLCHPRLPPILSSSLSPPLSSSTLVPDVLNRGSSQVKDPGFCLFVFVCHPRLPLLSSSPPPPSVILDACPRRLSPIPDYKRRGQALIGDPIKEWIQSSKGSSVFAFSFLHATKTNPGFLLSQE